MNWADLSWFGCADPPIDGGGSASNAANLSVQSLITFEFLTHDVTFVPSLQVEWNFFWG